MPGRIDANRRRGAVLIVVLVCLMVAAVIFVLLTRQAASEHRATQAHHRSVQALWLAEAGVERAVARLIADPKYAGETWAITATDLAAQEDAVVRIQVEAIADQPARQRVRVEADYPAAVERRCREVKQIVVDRNEVLSRGEAQSPR